MTDWARVSGAVARWWHAATEVVAPYGGGWSRRGRRANRDCGLPAIAPMALPHPTDVTAERERPPVVGRMKAPVLTIN